MANNFLFAIILFNTNLRSITLVFLSIIFLFYYRCNQRLLFFYYFSFPCFPLRQSLPLQCPDAFFGLFTYFYVACFIINLLRGSRYSASKFQYSAFEKFQSPLFIFSFSFLLCLNVVIYESLLTILKFQ